MAYKGVCGKRKQYQYKVVNKDGQTVLVTDDFIKAYDLMSDNPVERYQILTTEVNR